MKKLFLILFAFCSLGVFAQKDYDWKKMDPKQRKEIINKMSPEERKALLIKFRNNMVLEQLNIDADDKEEFTKLYNEYMDKQKQIKSQFDSDFNPETLSEEEAKTKLNQSFDVGQQMLDNRKEYAEKMQKVIPCQKVLKLFNSESMMRDKMNERKPHGDKKGSRP
ncbi:MULTISPECIES: hypothetical protein [Chryseobacterium]|uniref:Periplasmic heavy metal sensor n=1 Tax=Chryseobacterium caseinilyticum TaxID=2771428 RepID=A0ABR8ZCM8_9FLAO|nr:MULTISPECIES: hypothetical protein [Chryseobacterium]KQS90022.1 hypothetical protein ASG21_13735 [Chryseobacterium sp. Leaf394]MBD8083060.1 hypothetical protein [Chryseobacterium caseinilyticum]